MVELRRTALIEVGSYMIRYQVADYADALEFKTIFTDAAKHRIHPNEPSLEAIAEANRLIDHFVEDAERRRCQVIMVYGTAACRTAADRFPGILSPKVRVLTTREEALAGWVAGFACTSMAQGTSCTVIDEGSGSTEIVRATWTGTEFDEISYYSAHIGSIELLDGYKQNSKGHIERIRHVLIGMIPDFNGAGLVPGKFGDLFMIGGVATTIGWLAIKGGGMQNYRSSEVNGACLSRAAMDELYTYWKGAFRANPRAAAKAVDSRVGGEDHILKLLSSLPFLALLVEHLDPQGPYYVSGMSVRHGIGFMLWHGLLDS